MDDDAYLRTKAEIMRKEIRAQMEQEGDRRGSVGKGGTERCWGQTEQ